MHGPRNNPSKLVGLIKIVQILAFDDSFLNSSVSTKLNPWVIVCVNERNIRGRMCEHCRSEEEPDFYRFDPHGFSKVPEPRQYRRNKKIYRSLGMVRDANGESFLLWILLYRRNFGYPILYTSHAFFGEAHNVLWFSHGIK